MWLWTGRGTCRGCSWNRANVIARVWGGRVLVQLSRFRSVLGLPGCHLSSGYIGNPPVNSSQPHRHAEPPWRVVSACSPVGNWTAPLLRARRGLCLHAMLLFLFNTSSFVILLLQCSMPHYKLLGSFKLNPRWNTRSVPAHFVLHLRVIGLKCWDSLCLLLVCWLLTQQNNRWLSIVWTGVTGSHLFPWLLNDHLPV